jgi:hypothetical protein
MALWASCPSRHIFCPKKEGKTLTYTVQPLTRNDKKTEKTKETEAVENNAENNTPDSNILDSNIRELLSICDSLNKLCDTLGRLENAIKRKNIGSGKTQKL